MKKTMKKLLAFLMAFCLVVGIAMPDNKSQAASTSTTKYDGGYGIDEILSQFQFFVKEDVTFDSSGHTVGSLAVGGTLDLSNSFGDAGIVPSYIHTIKNGYVGTGWHGKVPVKSEIVYYGTDLGNCARENWYENPTYMDIEDAFEDITAESTGLAKLSTAEAVGLTNGSIVIDLTGVNADKVFNIKYADFDSASSVDIRVDNVDWFKDHLCVINITGVNSTGFTFDGDSKVKINGNQISTGLEAMTGADSQFNSQLNYSGMNLLWNLPDANGEIYVKGLGGHMVAPNATLNFVSGNYEGGLIAKKLKGGAQGHFYPMSKMLPKNKVLVTTDATFSKVDAGGGNELAEATLSLTYVSGGNAMAMSEVKSTSGHNLTMVEGAQKTISWKSTDAPNNLTKLPEGEYILTETAAPKGYKYAESIAFKIDSDGKVYLKNGNSYSTPVTNNTVVMKDDVKTASVTLEGTKLVQGKAVTETFEFEVYEGSTVVSTGSVQGAGKIAFTPIEYKGPNALGEHTYTVKEKKGGSTVGNITYDSTSYTVTVDVSDDGESDKLIVDVTYPDGGVKFTNVNIESHNPVANGELNILKTDDNNKALSGAKLKLTRISGFETATPMPLDAASVVVTNATVDAKDTTSITFTTTGKTVNIKGVPCGDYIITELVAPAGYKKADDIKLNVAEDINGTVTCTQMNPDGVITMVDEKKTVDWVLTGTKLVMGDATDEQFTFVLKDANKNEISRTTVNGAGTIKFDKVTISNTGDYTYYVSEVAGSTEGMEYDASEKKVKIKVKNIEGKDNLVVELFTESDKVEFINKYTEPTKEITPVVVPGKDVTISKKAVSADGAEVEGAKLTLTYESGSDDLRHVNHKAGPGIVISSDNKTITWTSATAPVELGNLPVGKYVLTETAAPAGYEYASDMKFEITADGVYQYNPATKDYSINITSAPKLTMVDKAKGGSITLTGTKKITGDSAASAPAEKFNFVVMEGDTQVATGTANGAGKITFTEIKYEGATGVGKHTYTITEKAGTTENMFYSKAELKVVVNVTDDGVKGSKLKAEIVAAESDAIEFTNKYTVPGNLIVTVYDEITKDIVPNADVEITDPQGEKTTYKTDENGQIKLDKIEPGDYYIETVKVPEGYTVSLGKTETATVVSKETTEHDVYITIPGKLIVTVYDEKTGDVVPDATVEITTPDGTKKEYKTDENGKIVIDNAQPGDYVVETVEVPSGYEVTLGKKETATVVSKKETEHDVYIDISTPGNLIVTVYDEKTGDVVPNATVEITDYTGETKEYTTDKDGKITVNGLTPGKYDIETTKVPEGYDVTLGKTETAMVEPGKTTSHDVYIGKDILGNLIVTVYDEKTKEVVPGATIKVTAPDGTSKEYTTNKNGKVTLNEIAAGDYKIETIKVPEGYTVTIGKVETATVVAGKTASHDVYINTKSATTTDTTDKTDKTDSHVKTGDTANLKLTFVLMFVSVVGAVYVLSMKKKRC